MKAVAGYTGVFVMGMLVMFAILSIQSKNGGWTGTDGNTYAITRVQ